MSVLAELQQDFAAAVRGQATDPAHLGINAAGLSAERRVGVYRNHHRISLSTALAANFPTVAAVIGEEAFHVLAAGFVALRPPVDPCIAAYGDGFAEFLARDARAMTLGYLADVARLDWACNVAQRADDLACFSPQHLAGLDEAALAALTLAPHPALTLLNSPYPLLKIRALAQGADVQVSLDEGGSALMVWRRGDQVAWRTLDDSGHAFIAALAAGVPLGEAAAGLVPAALPGLLAEAVLAGAFLAPTG